MPDRQPAEPRNLNRYGGPALPWARAHDLLESGPKGPLAGFFLGTVSPDGRPHGLGWAPSGTTMTCISPAVPALESHETWRLIPHVLLRSRSRGT